MLSKLRIVKTRILFTLYKRVKLIVISMYYSMCYSMCCKLYTEMSGLIVLLYLYIYTKPVSKYMILDIWYVNGVLFIVRCVRVCVCVNNSLPHQLMFAGACWFFVLHRIHILYS